MENTIYTGYMKDKTHYYATRVYYAQSDAGGVIYHGRYLDLFEVARTEMIATIMKKDKIENANQKGTDVAVRDLQIEYYKPAFLYDKILIETRITKVGGASMNIEQIMYRGEEKLVSVKLHLAYIDLNKMKPAKFEKEYKEKLSEYISEAKEQ